MHTRFIILGMLAAVASLTAFSSASAMSRYKWKYRPLVVFAPTAGDARLVRQRAIVASFRPAFIDRQMVVVYVTGDTVTADLGPSPRLDAEALRQRFGAKSREFKAVLIGKDGGVKLASSKPFPGPVLFRTIDAMPMRAEESRAKGRR